LELREEIREALKLLPDKPGVYLMHNELDTVIYVGKAISLKNRVRSYFQKNATHTKKIRRMVREVAYFETIITANEMEALILECNLIKQYRPYYNSMLKDDKGFPYLKVDLAAPYPTVTIERQLKQDGSRYFGPYIGNIANNTLQVIRRVFPIRTCKRDIRGNDGSPCLEYHIKRCPGPCVGAISQEEYAKTVQDILLFLDGKHDELTQNLQTKMEEAAENLEFEKASLLRDQWQAVSRLQDKQRVSGTKLGNRDVIAMAQGFNSIQIQIFFMRGGRVIGRDTYSLEEEDDQSRSEILSNFIRQYYSQVLIVPPEILVQEQLEDAPLLEEWLSQRSGHKVELKTPQRGEKRDLIELVANNALQSLGRSHTRRLNNKEEAQLALQELKQALGMSSMPVRMEAFDISNTQGSLSVASMVVFQMGIPDKNSYRRFKIKTVEGANDFASMAEVLRRRFQRALEQHPKFSVLPDLVLIDGGKGQLGAAREIMKELGFGHIPTIGLAKQFELVYMEDREEPIVLPPRSRPLFLLQRIRDEAHRFAITYHRNLRSSAALRSQLEQVPGIGILRTKALLKAFSSFEHMSVATLEELADVPGMNARAAEEVFRFLHQNEIQDQLRLKVAEEPTPYTTKPNGR
jgi:excinuclease ABC subunit C